MSRGSPPSSFLSAMPATHPPCNLPAVGAQLLQLKIDPQLPLLLVLDRENLDNDMYQVRVRGTGALLRLSHSGSGANRRAAGRWVCGCCKNQPGSCVPTKRGKAGRRGAGIGVLVEFPCNWRNCPSGRGKVAQS